MAHLKSNGFVKLDRGILDWEWYEDTYTARLFFHCILKANWKPGVWKGQPYKRGQFITSLPILAKELGCSVQNIRTALRHLTLTGELTDKATNKYRIITVCNYDKYQPVNSESNSLESNRQSNSQPNRQNVNQLTDIQQAENGINKPYNNDSVQMANSQPSTHSNRQNANQLTPDEEYKEIKNKRRNNIYGGFFEELWKIYPRKKDKASAYKKYQARLNDGYSENELLTATKAYAEECKRNHTEERYIKQGKSFFSSTTPFIDYLKAGEENAVQETEAERQQRLADEYNAKYANRY